MVNEKSKREKLLEHIERQLAYDRTDKLITIRPDDMWQTFGY